MNDDPVVVVSAKRTPIAAFMGCFSSLQATEIGAHAIRGAVNAIGLSPASVDEAIMGCVLPAGLGQSPARQASLMAGLPQSSGVTTINKVCGSGMKAVMLAHDLIHAGSAKTVLAGGMESMTNAPYLLPKARQGFRIGHQKVLDHMMHDGLENAYDGQAMGCFAQEMADKENLTRESMDTFALDSLTKAKQAQVAGHFDDEIVAMNITEKNTVTVDKDETPDKAKPDKIPLLKPAFKENGTITAANSSSISDGAAALILMPQSEAQRQGLTPLAKITAHTTHAQAPEEFTIAPIGAIQKLLTKTSWKIDEVDLFEINEAFAMVTMLATMKLNIPEEKVNINGGACALGHPIGASGARILVTLIHALRSRNLSRGIASLCIGGGEATAMAIEVC